MKRLRKAHRARVLEKLVKEYAWGLGAELGVFRGETFLHLMESCPMLLLTGVDLWRSQPEKAGHVGGRSYEKYDLEPMFHDLKEKTKKYGLRARLLRMDTAEAAEMFGDCAFDFVFIDADHTYEGVSRDIDAWYPKIRPGGWMLGHDWKHDDFPGVTQAVGERFDNVLSYADKVWAAPL